MQSQDEREVARAGSSVRAGRNGRIPAPTQCVPGIRARAEPARAQHRESGSAWRARHRAAQFGIQPLIFGGGACQQCENRQRRQRSRRLERSGCFHRRPDTHGRSGDGCGRRRALNRRECVGPVEVLLALSESHDVARRCRGRDNAVKAFGDDASKECRSRSRSRSGRFVRLERWLETCTGQAFKRWLLPRPEGLYCAAGDFYIDPTSPVERAVSRYGHSDHAHRGHGIVLTTWETLAIMSVRLWSVIAGSMQALRNGERLADVEVTLRPAGQVLGSAHAHAAQRGRRLKGSGGAAHAPAIGSSSPSRRQSGHQHRHADERASQPRPDACRTRRAKCAGRHHRLCRSPWSSGRHSV